MFTIDLLRGRGVPIKSKPGGTYLIAISFIVPVALASVIVGNYLHNRILISTRERLFKNCEVRLEALAPELEFQKAARKEKNYLSACRAEIADVIHWHIQWSPILQSLVEHIPEEVVLEKLEVKKSSVSREVPKRNAPEKWIDITVPKRVLVLNISLRADDPDNNTIKNFMYDLEYARLPGVKIEEVRMVHRSADKKTNTDHYELECTFEGG